DQPRPNTNTPPPTRLYLAPCPLGSTAVTLRRFHPQAHQARFHRIMPIVEIPQQTLESLADWRDPSLTALTSELQTATHHFITTLASTPDLAPHLAATKAENDRLTQDLAAARADLAVIREKKAECWELVRDLRSELREARSQLQAHVEGTSMEASSNRERIPDPERFDGTRSKLQAFVLQLRLKASTLAFEQAKLRLGVSCLTGEALDQV